MLLGSSLSNAASMMLALCAIFNIAAALSEGSSTCYIVHQEEKNANIETVTNQKHTINGVTPL